MNSAPHAPALIRFGATAPERRLFCLPFAGGGVAPFRLWTRGLPGDIEIAAVQLPGRESRVREPSFTSIDAIVQATLPLIEAHTDIPFAIFGHSMGALVAFELAAALERAGAPSPDHLFVSARRAPDEPDDVSPVTGLPDGEFLDALQVRYGAIPEAVRHERELLELLLPALRADIAAIESYQYTSGRVVKCAVTAYGGAKDAHPTPSQLEGWRRVASQPVRVRTFTGDHFYLTPQRDALIADLTSQWRAIGVRVSSA